MTAGPPGAGPGCEAEPASDADVRLAAETCSGGRVARLDEIDAGYVAGPVARFDALAPVGRDAPVAVDLAGAGAGAGEATPGPGHVAFLGLGDLPSDGSRRSSHDGDGHCAGGDSDANQGRGAARSVAVFELGSGSVTANGVPVAPVSVAPVSVAPVSVAPVSVAPVSVAPVPVAPVSVAPVPVAQVPVAESRGVRHRRTGRGAGPGPSPSRTDESVERAERAELAERTERASDVEYAADAGRRRAGPGSRSAPAELDPATDPLTVARTICLRLLTDRARTRQELVQVLRRTGVPDDAAAAVLDRFGDVGLIDDAAFAGQWVRSRHAVRGLGRRAIAVELRRKGVAEEVADEALAAVDGPAEDRRARQLVDRKLRSMPVGTKEQRAGAVRRLAGMLARKGYGAGVAYRVVREALADHGAEAEELDDLHED